MTAHETQTQDDRTNVLSKDTYLNLRATQLQQLTQIQTHPFIYQKNVENASNTFTLPPSCNTSVPGKIRKLLTLLSLIVIRRNKPYHVTWIQNWHPSETS